VGCVTLLPNAFVNRGGVNLLSLNLGRLDESVEDEAMCTKDEITLVESLLDLDRVGALGRGLLSSLLGDSGIGDDGDDGGEHHSVMAQICEQTLLVPWLFEQIERATYDPGGAAAAMSTHSAGLADAALVGGSLGNTASRGLHDEHAWVKAGGATKVLGWKRLMRGGEEDVTAMTAE
jgi:hypothetical protein